MIVADASVLVESLTGSAAARELLDDEQIQVSAVTDVEIASAFGKRVLLGQLTADEGWRALKTYRWMAVTRRTRAPGLRCAVTVVPG